MKIKKVDEGLKLLHDGLAPRHFRDRLSEELHAAWKSNECKRYLLNHLAFFPDNATLKAMIATRSQCCNCNQYFKTRQLAKHEERGDQPFGGPFVHYATEI